MTSVHVEATWTTGLKKKHTWTVKRREHLAGKVSTVKVRFMGKVTAFSVSIWITRQQLIGNGAWTRFNLFVIE